MPHIDPRDAYTKQNGTFQQALHKGTYAEQNDCIGATTLSADVREPLPLLLRNTMERGRQAVFKARRDGATATELGSCACAIVAHDPKKHEVDVRTVDDCMAFLILDDGKKTAVVMITTPVGHEVKGLGTLLGRLNGYKLIASGGRIIEDIDDILHEAAEDPSLHKALSALTNEHFCQTASYQLKSHKRHDGPISIERVMDEAAEAYEMSRQNMKVHLVLTSDGILTAKDHRARQRLINDALEDYPLFDLEKKEFIRRENVPESVPPPNRMMEKVVQALYEDAKASPNIAQGMIDAALRSKANDNLSIVFAPNLKQSNDKGPLVACVYDAAGETKCTAPRIAAEAAMAYLHGLEKTGPAGERLSGAGHSSR